MCAKRLHCVKQAVGKDSSAYVPEVLLLGVALSCETLIVQTSRPFHGCFGQM